MCEKNELFNDLPDDIDNLNRRKPHKAKSIFRSTDVQNRTSSLIGAKISIDKIGKPVAATDCTTKLPLPDLDSSSQRFSFNRSISVENVSEGKRYSKKKSTLEKENERLQWAHLSDYWDYKEDRSQLDL